MTDLFPKSVDDDAVKRIFIRWQTLRKHPRVKLDIVIANVIAAMFLKGYTEEDMELAIIGVDGDSWACRNEHDTLHDILSLDKVVNGEVKKGNFIRFMKLGEMIRAKIEKERKRQEAMQASRERGSFDPAKVANLKDALRRKG